VFKRVRTTCSIFRKIGGDIDVYSLQFEDEQDIHMNSKIYEKWVQTQFGFANHLILIVVFSYLMRNRCKAKSVHIRPAYLRVHESLLAMCADPVQARVVTFPSASDNLATSQFPQQD
jgi:hypothetical protein